MRVDGLYGGTRPVVSFEFFPPATAEGEAGFHGIDLTEVASAQPPIQCDRFSSCDRSKQHTAV